MQYLETERLNLQQRTMADLNSCLDMDRDPDVTRYIPGPWAEPASHRAFVVERIEKNYPDGLGYWSVFKKSPESEFIGWVLLLPCSFGGNPIEIGWRFVKSSWGNGFATEAAKAILNQGQSDFPKKMIVAES